MAPRTPPRSFNRSTEEEKQRQINNLEAFQNRNRDTAHDVLLNLQNVARDGSSMFEALMQAVQVCSLGDITHALFEVGGQYRRSM